MELKTYLESRRRLIEKYLKELYSRKFQPAPLREAMRYSLLAGGKRLRPVLALAACEACGKDSTPIIPYASALELIHTYSLVHDDLPAMDDDELRRGKPTNHVVYGEATAILVGDALLTEAFRLLSEPREGIQPRRLLMAINDLAVKAGIGGMVAGQSMDMEMEKENVRRDAKTLDFIHKHKTGALITASVRLGAIVSGAGDKKLEALTAYGDNMGLSFQIVDDILDVEGTTESLGKPAGSDEKNHKLTWPALYGMERSVKEARRLMDRALESIEGFPRSAEPLRLLARYIIERTN